MLTTDQDLLKWELLRPQMRALQCVALWPFRTNNTFIRIYVTLMPIFLVIVSVALITTSITSSNLIDVSEATDMMTMCATAPYKFLFFAYHQKEIINLVYDTEKIISLAPKGWIRYQTIITICYTGSAFVTISFWGFCPVINYILGLSTYEEMELPMKIYLPYELHGFTYLVVFIICYFCLISSSHIYMSIDTLFFSMIHLVNGSMKNLAQRLEDLEHFPPQDREEILKRWIDDHSYAIRYIQKLDRLLRTLIIADLIHATISLSFVVFQSSESKNGTEWVKAVSYIVVCFGHQFCNSFFGQQIIDGQERISQSVKYAPWLDSPLRVKKMLLQIMSNTLSPIELSAYRMYFLRYSSFLEFVKFIISTYMLLRQVQDTAAAYEKM